MKTNFIENSIEDDPLAVLKGCVSLLNGLDDEFVEDNDSHLGIRVLSEIMRDAVSRIENEKKESVKR